MINPSQMHDATVHPQIRWNYVLLCSLCIFILFSNDCRAQNHKIAIFGSSVANGSGDTTGAGGYAGLLKNMFEEQGWQVVNVSKGSDNTTKILPRFEAQLLPEKPGYVIIGLSLGNEGIAAESELNRNRSFEKYRQGMLHLIDLCRKNSMFPIVVNCYARSDFKEAQYEAIRKMNLIINTWDVPSVNVLGPIDNGMGNWLENCRHDKSHPDFNGHREMFYAFVPSLFKAIEAGKPLPFKTRYKGYVTISQPESFKPLSYTSDYQIHSFTVSFQVKTSGNGTCAVIQGDTLSTIEFNNGKIEYHPINQKTIAADTTAENKGWQYVVLTHQYASGKTTFYVNGKPAGNTTEFIDFKSFILGGQGDARNKPAPALASYKDLLIYRSVLNKDEVLAHYYNQLLQSSLEVYAPLNDPEFHTGSSAANLAQSLSELVIDGNGFKSVNP
jgi:lysophospholipase L1-like esterase